MTTATRINPMCSGEALTPGQIILDNNAAGARARGFRDATHLLSIDLFPTARPATTLFVDPTIDVTVETSGARFVPAQESRRSNGRYEAELAPGAGFTSYVLREDRATVPAPTATHVRWTMAGVTGTLEWAGSAESPNGLSFAFGLLLPPGVTAVSL